MPTLTRPICLQIVGDKEEKDRVWEQLRIAIENQNKEMNNYLSDLWTFERQGRSTEDKKELHKLYQREPNSKKGCAYSGETEFFKGLNVASNLQKKVKQVFDNAMKKGLMYGNISLPSFKKDNPLIVPVEYIKLKKLSKKNDGIYHNYQSHTEFLEHLHKTDLEVLIKFANQVTFKMIFGNPHKSRFLREEIKNIFEENYQVQGSSIQIKGKDIILNLCMDIPKREVELKEDVILGVDLGVVNPATCALNDDNDKWYSWNFIGDGIGFQQQRHKFKAQIQRIQRNIKYMTNGGHGRTKKMVHLTKIKAREKNAARTFNHKISKQIVNLAVANNAATIQLEDLSNYKPKAEKDETKKKLLGVWGYYQLQQDIEYKAAGYGIKVKYVNPAYTSKTCSFCGEIGKRTPEDRDHFYCQNEKCEKYNMKLDADWNAARNIAFSTDYTEKNKDTSEEDDDISI